MNDYRVQLDIYNGPLDLLLYLIRRDELDIHDIPISRITSQYIEYVGLIQQLDIDVAGDFLVLAATLMEIKSAMLIPRGQVTDDQEEDDLSDPRLTLVRQLLEYKKFKDLAGGLGDAYSEHSSRHGRSLADLARLRDEEKKQQELDIDSLQIWDLFEAFNRLMQATLAGKRKHHVIHDDTPIDVYETDILYRCQHENPLAFQSIFAACESRGEIMGMFLALLELIRQKLVRIEQEKTFGTIYIFALTDEPAEIAVAHAVSADINRLPSDINKDKQTHKPNDQPNDQAHESNTHPQAELPEDNHHDSKHIENDLTDTNQKQSSDSNPESTSNQGNQTNVLAVDTTQEKASTNKRTKMTNS